MKKFSHCLAALALSSLALTPVATAAQQSNNLSDPLGIPDTITILGPDNPNERKATAIVNGQVITGTDVDQRVALITSASKAKISDAELKRLRMQVLRNLIDETLEIQAASQDEIEIPQADIDQSYARVAAQNFGSDLSKMDTYLKQVGSSPASLKRQIHGELAWQRLLQRRIAPFVNVSEEEVNEVLKRLEASRGTDEYRLGEIYLSATPENRTAVFENAKRIVDQLQQGGSFVGYARQFSEASTAAVGGDLGFVRLAQLPPALANVARDMQAGQLVGPIEIPGGFSILYLIDKRKVLTADPRDALLSLKQISISFKPGTTQEQATKRVEAFTAGVKALRGCGDADTAVGKLGASVVANDQVRARSLPEQLQNLVLQLQIGQTTPPFGSVQDGVRVLMLCGRDDPVADKGPSFDSLMARMEDERINKRAQRYLRDLRNDAYIEYN